MKTIIIDKAQNARSALSSLLRANYRQVELLGEAADGVEGLECIRRLKPDLVFSEVELPEKTGFQMLEELDTIDFALVFVTASNQFAAQAYEYSPVDYLLKPIDEPRSYTGSASRVLLPAHALVPPISIHNLAEV